MATIRKKPEPSKADKKNANVRVERDLLLAIPGSVYGQINRVLGDKRYMVLCFDDSKERLCSLRNINIKNNKKKNNKKRALEVGSIVMIGIRDYQDEKGDIIYHYRSEEAMELKKMGLITKTGLDMQFCSDDEEDDIGFDFDSI